MDIDKPLENLYKIVQWKPKGNPMSFWPEQWHFGIIVPNDDSTVSPYWLVEIHERGFVHGQDFTMPDNEDKLPLSWFECHLSKLNEGCRLNTVGEVIDGKLYSNDKEDTRGFFGSLGTRLLWW